MPESGAGARPLVAPLDRRRRRRHVPRAAGRAHAALRQAPAGRAVDVSACLCSVRSAPRRLQLCPPDPSQATELTRCAVLAQTPGDRAAAHGGRQCAGLPRVVGSKRRSKRHAARPDLRSQRGGRAAGSGTPGRAGALGYPAHLPADDLVTSCDGAPRVHGAAGTACTATLLRVLRAVLRRRGLGSGYPTHLCPRAREASPVLHPNGVEAASKTVQPASKPQPARAGRDRDSSPIHAAILRHLSPQA